MRLENHNGVIYTAGHPVVCEDHPGFGRITVGSGMVSERGLICPMCYKPARLATSEEADSYRAVVGGAS